MGDIGELKFPLSCQHKIQYNKNLFLSINAK